jgi:hypothetical protein
MVKKYGQSPCILKRLPIRKNFVKGTGFPQGSCHRRTALLPSFPDYTPPASGLFCLAAPGQGIVRKKGNHFGHGPFGSLTDYNIHFGIPGYSLKKDKTGPDSRFFRRGAHAGSPEFAAGYRIYTDHRSQGAGEQDRKTLALF